MSKITPSISLFAGIMVAMFLASSIATEVRGDHPEAAEERDQCIEEAFINFNPKHSDDSGEDQEAFKEWSDKKLECIDKYNEHTEVDAD